MVLYTPIGGIPSFGIPSFNHFHDFNTRACLVMLPPLPKKKNALHMHTICIATCTGTVRGAKGGDKDQWDRTLKPDGHQLVRTSSQHWAPCKHDTGRESRTRYRMITTTTTNKQDNKQGNYYKQGIVTQFAHARNENPFSRGQDWYR